jgi:hypothetical protein
MQHESEEGVHDMISCYKEMLQKEKLEAGQ